MIVNLRTIRLRPVLPWLLIGVGMRDSLREVRRTVIRSSVNDDIADTLGPSQASAAHLSYGKTGRTEKSAHWVPVSAIVSDYLHNRARRRRRGEMLKSLDRCNLEISSNSKISQNQDGGQEKGVNQYRQCMIASVK